MDVSRSFTPYPTVAALRAARDRWALYAATLRSCGATERATNIEAVVNRADNEIAARQFLGVSRG